MDVRPAAHDFSAQLLSSLCLRAGFLPGMGAQEPRNRLGERRESLRIT